MQMITESDSTHLKKPTRLIKHIDGLVYVLNAKFISIMRYPETNNIFCIKYFGPLKDLLHITIQLHKIGAHAHYYQLILLQQFCKFNRLQTIESTSFQFSDAHLAYFVQGAWKIFG